MWGVEKAIEEERLSSPMFGRTLMILLRSDFKPADTRTITGTTTNLPVLTPILSPRRYSNFVRQECCCSTCSILKSSQVSKLIL